MGGDQREDYPASTSALSGSIYLPLPLLYLALPLLYLPLPLLYLALPVSTPTSALPASTSALPGLYICSSCLYLCSTCLYLCSTFLYMPLPLLYLVLPLLYLALPLLYLRLPASTSALPGSTTALPASTSALSASTWLYLPLPLRYLALPLRYLTLPLLYLPLPLLYLALPASTSALPSTACLYLCSTWLYICSTWLLYLALHASTSALPWGASNMYPWYSHIWNMLLQKTKQFASKICNKNWDDAYHELLDMLDLPSLAQRRLHTRLCYVYKIVHRLLYFPPDVVPSSALHRLPSRDAAVAILGSIDRNPGMHLSQSPDGENPARENPLASRKHHQNITGRNLGPCKDWDQQLCARFPIPYQRDCGKRFHYSDEEVGKII